MLAAVLAFALAIPPAPTGRVNDYAGVLPAGDRARLETLLAEREGATGAQMVIAIFLSLKGESLEDYSIRLAQQWRIGQKGLDNGVILLVFVRDRKVRFEVGYGLEPVVPDVVVGRIIREVAAPRFREGRYAAGLEGAVDAVFSRVTSAKETSEHRARERRPPSGVLPFSAPGVVALVFVVVFALIGASFLNVALSPRGRNRRRIYTLGSGGWYTPSDLPWRGGGSWSGGGFSGGGGSFGGGGASGEW